MPLCRLVVPSLKQGSQAAPRGWGGRVCNVLLPWGQSGWLGQCSPVCASSSPGALLSDCLLPFSVRLLTLGNPRVLRGKQALHKCQPAMLGPFTVSVTEKRAGSRPSLSPTTFPLFLCWNLLQQTAEGKEKPLPGSRPGV